METRDIIIVGAGPAGLAAAARFRDAGYDTLVFDKASLGDGIVRYPVYLKFFSTAANLELEGFPLIIRDEKPSREEYLNYLRRFVSDKGIPVRPWHRVTAVERQDDGGFVVSGANSAGDPFAAACRYLVISTGAYDQPQMLGIPGEDLPKVSHYFTEVHPYAFSRTAIIGGRSSAAETALLLWRAGAEVTLIHRRERLEGLKYWIQPDIDNRIRDGEIRAFFNSRVTAIEPHHIVIEDAAGASTRIENDFVLAMTGYQPDTAFLHSMGIRTDPQNKAPEHDPATLETNVPNIFVAGVIVCGNISGTVFIENSRHHGGLILDAIRAREAAPAR